jgi:hypothetical protein
MTHKTALGFNQYNTNRSRFTTDNKALGTMRDAAMLMPVGRPLKDAVTIFI